MMSLFNYKKVKKKRVHGNGREVLPWDSYEVCQVDPLYVQKPNQSNLWRRTLLSIPSVGAFKMYIRSI